MSQKPKVAPKQKAKKSAIVPKAKPKVSKVLAKKNKYPKFKLRPPSLETELKMKRGMGCIPPADAIIVLDFERSWGRVYDAIDAFIRQAQLRNPNVFVRSFNSAASATPRAPAIRFSTLRTCWLYLINQYWSDLGLINGANSTTLIKVQNAKLPIGLARLAQQFAPYVDTVTGTTYRVSIPPLASNMVVYSSYPDISAAGSAGTSAAANTSAYRSYYHIHPTDWVSAGVNNFDYATSSATNDPVYGFVNTTTPVATYLGSITADETASMNKLFATVDVKDLGKFAPDGSAYCVTNPLGVSSPVPRFNPTMGVLTGYFRDNGQQVDLLATYPYVKAIPVVRANKTGNTITYINGYRTVLYNLYAYLSSYVTTYDPRDTALSQLRWTECFKHVKTLSYHGTTVAMDLAADRLSQIIDGLNKNSATTANTTVNGLYGLTVSYWSALIYRVRLTDAITDMNNNYRGYCHGDILAGNTLPATLARVISGIGPIIINGRAYFPQFSYDIGPWVNSLAPTTGFWRMSPTGGSTTFIPYQTCYNNKGTRDSSTPTNADGGGIIPLAATRYSQIPSVLLGYFIKQSRSLAGINSSRNIPITTICMGTPNKMTGIVQFTINAGDYGNAYSLVGQYERLYQFDYYGAYHFLCATQTDAFDALMFGLIGSTNTDANVLKPLVMVTTSDVSDIFPQMQAEYEGVNGDMANAMIIGSTMKNAVPQQNIAMKTKGLELATNTKVSKNTYFTKGQEVLLSQFPDKVGKIFDLAMPNYESAEKFIEFLTSPPPHIVNLAKEINARMDQRVDRHRKRRSSLIKTIMNVGASSLGGVASVLTHSAGLVTHLLPAALPMIANVAGPLALIA